MSIMPDDRAFRAVAVYCGSSLGRKPEYAAAAQKLGEELVKRGIGLVYGGGNVGLMGVIAKTVAGGLGSHRVLGVIPTSLEPREISGVAIGNVKVVDNMHIRKAMISEEADAFVALPGGFGTLEELLEVVSWQQLGFHQKPVGVLNICGFYDLLCRFADHLVSEPCKGLQGLTAVQGFVTPEGRNILQSADTPAELLDKLLIHTPPTSLIKLRRQNFLDQHCRSLP